MLLLYICMQKLYLATPFTNVYEKWFLSIRFSLEVCPSFHVKCIVLMYLYVFSVVYHGIRK